MYAIQLVLANIYCQIAKPAFQMKSWLIFFGDRTHVARICPTSRFATLLKFRPNLVYRRVVQCPDAPVTGQSHRQKNQTDLSGDHCLMHFISPCEASAYFCFDRKPSLYYDYSKEFFILIIFVSSESQRFIEWIIRGGTVWNCVNSSIFWR